MVTSKYCVIFLYVVFFSLSPVVRARNSDVYQLNRKKDIAIMGGGIVLFSAGSYLVTHMNPSDPAVLDRDRIFYLDRFAVDYSCKETASFSDITSGLCIGLPAITLLTTRSRETILQDLLMYVESLSYIQGLTFLSKAVFRRPRPYAYHLSENPDEDLSVHAICSFFSGHTALAFNGVVFAATVFQKRNPYSSLIKPIWFLGISSAVVTGLFRVTSGNHFPTDVIVGALVGAFTGWIIPYSHEVNDQDKKLSIIFGNRIGIRYHL